MFNIIHEFAEGCYMKSTGSVILALLLLSILILGCSQKENHPPKIVVTLFDLTDSTKNQDIRNEYCNNMKTVLRTLKGGDVFVAARITDKSYMDMKLLANEVLPIYESSLNDTDLMAKRNKKKYESALSVEIDNISNSIDSSIGSNQPVKYSDIMGSISNAAAIFSRYTTSDVFLRHGLINTKRVAPKKVLIIFSDMLEDSEQYNFSSMSLSDERIKQVIGQQLKSKQIPDLSGVKVYVVGAAAVNQTKFNQIKSFWGEYFKEAKADYSVKNYGLSLVTFNE